MTKKFYVTTPLYYPNARPHLGSLYSTLLADVATRWHKLQGEATFMLTGTDEHGQKIAEAAEKAGKTPRAFVDNIADLFKALWREYNIEYNHFIRTTDEHHKQAIQQWILKLQEQGDIYKAFYTGWYCTSCETFVTDQGSTQDPQQGPHCASCGRTTTQVSEESYFFRLSDYQERLLAFYKSHPQFITPSERLNEIISFVESGLKDLSISRATVTWGIPFPGDDRHVIYVWADALNNYITGIGYGDPAKKKEFDFWWPADMQVLGKDIARFHAIYWPAFLMATGLPLPRRLLVHGWIKIGDQKMSKSLGNIVDPQELARIYGIDPVRYYLVRYMAVTQDSPFSIEDLEQRITSDLANDLGNLVNRMLTLALKHDLIKVEAPLAWNIQEQELQYKLQQLVRLMKQDIYDGLFHRAYAHLGIFVSLVNSYFHAREPWRVVKQSKEDFNQIISAVCHSLYGIALLLWPVMPQKMNSLLEALGVKLIFGDNVIDSIEHDVWKRTFSLTQIPPLFVKPEHRGIAPVPQAEETVDDKEITINDFNKMELRVGTIDAVDEIPKSEKLFKLTVNFGEQGIRTICSGIKQRIAKEELLNKQLVFVFNLQPRMLMGIASHGMLLTAENDDKTLRIITVSGPVANGTRLK